MKKAKMRKRTLGAHEETKTQNTRNSFKKMGWQALTQERTQT